MNVKPETDLSTEINREICRLQGFSTRGAQALGLFCCLSVVAWAGSLYLPFPDAAVAALGKPPSARLISVALLLYIFSALFLSLSRMSTGIEHRSSFSHVAYLSAFYLFYYFGKSLETNFWAVFGAGMTILGVESYRIRSFCSERIALKKEELEFVARTGRPPPQE